MISCGNVSSSSQRRALGTMRRSHSSRTDDCRTRCSSVRSKSVISSFGLGGRGGAVALLRTGGGEDLQHHGLAWGVWLVWRALVRRRVAIDAREPRRMGLPLGNVERLVGPIRDLLASDGDVAATGDDVQDLRA